MWTASLFREVGAIRRGEQLLTTESIAAVSVGHQCTLPPRPACCPRLTMLRVSDLSKSYGTRTLFDGVTFAITPGERLGLVGRNGSGKTTLFRLIMDREVADAGRIERPRQYTVEHLSQHLEFKKKTVLEEACSNLPVQEGGWVEQHRAEEALMGLGFSVADFDRPPQELSGGFQVRLQLARVLVSAPDLLLLDEPTNYLDIVSVRWLQRYLRSWKGELILITNGSERRLGPGDWYHLLVGETHAARFEVATSEIEFWFEC